MQRGSCQACGQTLSIATSAVLMDREDRRYHLPCWTRMMAAQAAAAKRTAKRAATSRKAATARPTRRGRP